MTDTLMHTCSIGASLAIRFFEKPPFCPQKTQYRPFLGVKFSITFIISNSSRGPTPSEPTLIVGFPGFRTKIWTFHEATGAFQGIYEWDSAEAAADYAKSLAIRLMKKRAVPESVDQEMIPDTSIGEYLSSLI